jgi:hypothetical protein
MIVLIIRITFMLRRAALSSINKINTKYRKFSDFKSRLIEQSNILRCHQICFQNGQSAYSIFKTLYADWAILDTNLMKLGYPHRHQLLSLSHLVSVQRDPALPYSNASDKIIQIVNLSKLSSKASGQVQKENDNY